MSDSAHDVQVRLGQDAKATFVLAEETDPAGGTVDLTDMLKTLLEIGVAHPRQESPDGILFGTLETDGEISASVDGRTLSEAELAEAVAAGFVRAIHLAIDEAHDELERRPAASAGGQLTQER